jgi:outer membrane phospholipase A
MKIIPAALLWFVFVSTSALPAGVDLLLVPPPETEPLSPRPELILYLNNPTEFDATIRFEEEIEAEMADASGLAYIRLRLVDATQCQVSVPKMSRRSVRLRPASDLTSRGEFFSLRLRFPASNPIMLRASPTGTGTSAEASGQPNTNARPPAATAAVPRTDLGRRHIDLTSDIENMRRHISGYEPIYFAVGWRERFNARFQFSFKYRPIDPGSDSWEDALWLTLLGKVHFAYTQTSIWDLESFSKPFYDSSYKPTIFLLHPFRRITGSNWSFSLQAGGQHESNGKGGGAAPVSQRPGLISTDNSVRHPFDSRSLNTLYALPRARWEDDTEHFFEAALRTSAYFQQDENSDIARYRGYVELTLRGGYVRGLQLSTLLRGKIDGHGSIECNLTWPTSETPYLNAFPLISTLGGYAQLQYFNGYGESLLDYDVRRKDQLRFGVMIVR